MIDDPQLMEGQVKPLDFHRPHREVVSEQKNQQGKRNVWEQVWEQSQGLEQREGQGQEQEPSSELW